MITFLFYPCVFEICISDANMYKLIMNMYVSPKNVRSFFEGSASSITAFLWHNLVHRFEMPYLFWTNARIYRLTQVI